jgi:hypothetical protein
MFKLIANVMLTCGPSIKKKEKKNKEQQTGYVPFIQTTCTFFCLKLSISCLSSSSARVNSGTVAEMVPYHQSNCVYCVCGGGWVVVVWWLYGSTAAESFFFPLFVSISFFAFVAWLWWLDGDDDKCCLRLGVVWDWWLGWC